MSSNSAGYEPPRLEILGTVTELTQGVTKPIGISDQGSMSSTPSDMRLKRRVRKL